MPLSTEWVAQDFDPQDFEAYTAMSGIVYIEPDRWQLICVPTRFGSWAAGALEQKLLDNFTDLDGTDLRDHTGDTGEGWGNNLTSMLIQGNVLKGPDSTVLETAISDLDLSSYIGELLFTLFANIPSGPGDRMDDTELLLGIGDYDNDEGYYIKYKWNTTPSLPVVEFYRNGVLQDAQAFVVRSDTVGLEVSFNEGTITVTRTALPPKIWTDPVPLARPNRWWIGHKANNRAGVYYYPGLDFIRLDGAVGTLVPDGVTPATVKNYVIDQLEAKYGAGVVQVANAYFGDDDFFRNYVPGVTPEGSDGNFPLALEDPVGSGNYEFTAFWIRSLHSVDMELEWRYSF